MAFFIKKKQKLEIIQTRTQDDLEKFLPSGVVSIHACTDMCARAQTHNMCASRLLPERLLYPRDGAAEDGA